MKKQMLILILCMGVLQTSYAQYFFNNRETLHSFAATLSSVVPRDGLYYCTGVCVDSINSLGGGFTNNVDGIKFAIFDSTGKLIRDTVYQLPFVRNLFAWNNSLYPMPDKGFLLAVGQDVDTNSKSRMMLVRYDSAGNVQWTKEYDAPFCGDSIFYKVVDMKPTGTGEWLALATVGCNVSGDSGVYQADIGLTKLDSNFNVIWSKEYGNPSYNDGAGKILVVQDGYILGGCMTNTNVASIHYIFQAELIKTDTAGSVIWDWHSNSGKKINTGTMDLIQTKDGGYVYCGQGGGYEVLDNPTASEVEWKGWIEKIDANRNVVWNDTFSTLPTSADYNALSVLKELPDSSIIIAGMVGGGFGPNDTADLSFGALIKMSEDGNLIWEHKYQVPNDTLIYHIYDMKLTPDGGFVFSGEADDDYYPVVAPKQRGWIVKVDSNGCLGPDDPQCQPVGVRALSAGTSFSVYPNPNSGTFTVRETSPQPSPKEREVLIYNTLGQVVYRKTFTSPLERTGEVFSLNVPSGVYMVEVTDGNGGRMVQQFVIIK